MLGLTWRLALMTLLVFLARIAVLRAREKYADALVARWTDDPTPVPLPPTSRYHRWFHVPPGPGDQDSS